MKKVMITAFAVFAMAMASTAWGNCSSRDFGVENLDIHVDNCSGRNCPRVVITGELINNCSSPAAARIEIEAKNSRGQTVDSVDGWPARTNNIQPGESVEFDFSAMMDFDRSMSDFAVSITDARVW